MHHFLLCSRLLCIHIEVFGWSYHIAPALSREHLAVAFCIRSFVVTDLLRVPLYGTVRLSLLLQEGTSDPAGKIMCSLQHVC
jgi:hypothetical protein